MGFEATLVAGVDTHKDSHVLCVLDGLGRKVHEGVYPATAGGYDEISRAIGPADGCMVVGIEGTCSFGAGLSARLSHLGYNVVEVLRPKRDKRRRGSGRNDYVDAERAARDAAASNGVSIPKSRDGWSEAARPLLCARSMLVGTQTRVSNLVKSLIDTAPEPIREKYSKLGNASMMAALSRKRKPTGDLVTDGPMSALRSMAKTWIEAADKAAELESAIEGLVRREAPALLEVNGCGAISAATLGIAAGDNPGRMGSEAAFAMLCGASPIEASSGRTVRHRLNRGGNRKANQALHSIVINRMRYDERTSEYVERRTSEGKSKREIIRCLKRYVAREVYRALLHPKETHHPSGESLRARRAAVGLTQKAVAESLGTESMRISEIETERRKCFDLRDAYDKLLERHEKGVLALDAI